MIALNPLVKRKITHEILNIPGEKPTQHEIEKIKSERPSFLNNLNRINDLMKL